MQYGFGSGQPDDRDELMKKLRRFLGDTGFDGLESLLARLFGGVAPTEGGRGRVPPPGGGGGGNSGGGPPPYEFPPVQEPGQTGA